MLYERIYTGPGTDPVEIEPRPLVFEDVAAQARQLQKDYPDGQLMALYPHDPRVEQGEGFPWPPAVQEFRLRVGDRLWIWRPLDTM